MHWHSNKQNSIYSVAYRTRFSRSCSRLVCVLECTRNEKNPINHSISLVSLTNLSCERMWCWLTRKPNGNKKREGNWAAFAMAKISVSEHRIWAAMAGKSRRAKWAIVTVIGTLPSSMSFENENSPCNPIWHLFAELASVKWAFFSSLLSWSSTGCTMHFISITIAASIVHICMCSVADTYDVSTRKSSIWHETLVSLFG